MKTNKLLALLFSLGFILSSCGGGNSNNDGSGNKDDEIIDPTPKDDDPADKTVNVEQIALNKPNLNLYVGETSALNFTISPENATNKNVTWGTSNSKVATVDNGTVTALSSGEATITVVSEDGNKVASCLVNVSVKPSNIESIAVDRTNSSTDSLIYYVGESFTTKGLVILATLNNGGEPVNVVNECTFTNTSIVYDDVEKGKYVQVKHTPSGLTCQYWISIFIPTENDKAVTSVSVSDIETEVDKKVTATATVKPAETYWKEVAWSIEDTSIATINAETGEINALKEGRTTFTATSVKYPSKKGSAELVVTAKAKDYGYQTAAEINALAKSLPTYEGVPFVNSKNTVKIKAKALDILAFVTTSAEDGGDAKPSKVLLADDTGYVFAASGTGSNELATNAKKYLDKPSLGSTYYTVEGTVAMYRGVPEIQITSYSWSEVANCTYDLDTMAETMDTAEAMFNYTKNLDVNIKGMAAGKMIKTTATCIYQVDKNGSYLFRDKNNNTFNVYQPFGTGFVDNKEYDLVGLITMYNSRTSLRALKAAATGNTPSEFVIKDHSVNTTIAALYDVKAPSGTDINEEYMKSNSTIYCSEVYVDAYIDSSNWDYVVADSIKSDWTIANSKNNVVGANAVWISNDNYWNVNPTYFYKGILSEYCLANNTNVTEENLSTYKVKIYYTLNLLNADTGVSNKSAWKISVIESLIPHYGTDPNAEYNVLSFKDKTNYEKVNGTTHTWTNGDIKMTSSSVDTFGSGFTTLPKTCTLSFTSSKNIKTIEISYYQSYGAIETQAFKNCTYISADSGKKHIVSLTTPSTSFTISTSNKDSKIKITEIKVLYE